MRIGISASPVIGAGASLSELVAHAVKAERDGFSTYWLTQLAVPDALTAMVAIGNATSTIELGTGVVPTWTRHPLVLAGQAITVQAATGNRLLLGIGVAHKPSIEGRFNIPFTTPAKHMDEYLSVLLPALRERKVSFVGDIWSGRWELPGAADAVAPSVMLAAMGPRMLQLAGARTAGTVLWLSGPKVIKERIEPALTAAAAEAGNPAPRIAAAVPVVITARPDEVRRHIDSSMARYRDLPSYRDVLEASGAEGPGDVALVGDEHAVRDGLAAFAATGVTDFTAIEYVTTEAEVAATRAFLAEEQGCVDVWSRSGHEREMTA